METSISTITKITDLGEGTRIILDFVDELAPDEGVLIGNTCKGFIHVVSESRSTETYPPRRFRVNCGALFQYIYVGEAGTNYLSEIKPGDKITVISPKSERIVAVGRVKKEKRPLQRIETESGISASLQKADSVYVRVEGELTDFTKLKEQDTITIYPDTDQGRHKGEIINEYIEEI